MVKRTWEDAVAIIDHIAKKQAEVVARAEEWDDEDTLEWLAGRKSIVDAILNIMKDDALTEDYLKTVEESA